MTEQEKKDITFIDKGIYDNPLLYNPLTALPDERRTAEVCRFAVQKSAYSIQFVPEALKTPELCLAAVSRRGETLNFVPEEAKTLELCQAAIRNNGQALAFVPETLRTPELCMEAVRNRGWALKDVPEEVKTPQMCREALKRIQSDYMILAEIPYAEVCLEGLQKFSGTLDQDFKIFAAIDPEIMTERLALEGVRMDASCLSLVPAELRTESVCMEAVGKVGIMLYEVPEQMRTAKICEAAVSSNFRAMEYVPKELRTQDLYEKALENNPLAIQYFKPEQLTHEICQKALARCDDLRVLHYIPFGDIHERTLKFYCTDYHKTLEFLRRMNPKHMTVKLAKMIYEREKELISVIPDHCKDRELCEAAVRYNGNYLKWIPDALKTPDLCREAIQRSPYAIEYIPDALKTPDLCREAIKRSPYVIKYIPDGMKSPELYMNLVRENPENLIGIPRKERTYDMCREAFDNTYGKDKSDYFIIRALTEPSLVVQVFREHDDPMTIRFLMDLLHLNRWAIDEQVALEAVRKNGSVLCSVPPAAITPQVAEAAVKNAPYALQWVPPAIRTPDMYLYAAKNGGDPSVIVPEELKNGNNLYSFAQRMEARLGQSLRYEDHKRLYAGEEIRVKNVRTAAGVMGLCSVRYDPDKGRLYFRDQTPTQTARQGVKPVIKPKKPAKGPKL